MNLPDAFIVAASGAQLAFVQCRFEFGEDRAGFLFFIVREFSGGKGKVTVNLCFKVC